MWFIGILSVLTGAIVFVTSALWKKTHSVGFVVGAFFLYYWSLYGAWEILNGFDLGSHGYLLDDLVSVTVDSTYFWTISLYGAFVLTVLLSAYSFTAMKRPQLPKPKTVLVIKCAPLLLVSLIAGGLSYFLVSQSFFLSSQLGRSVYQLVRMDGELGASFSLHTIANRIALIPAATGLATILSGRNPRFVVMQASWWNTLVMSIVVGSMSVLCLVLGNKNELLFAATLGSLVYLSNARRPNWRRLSWIVAVGLLLFPTINATRSKSLDEIKEGFSTDQLIAAFESLGMTGETFAAHMSLYGVLDQEVPLVYGQSFVSLILSVVPRALWEDRPDDIYSYYVDSIDASLQQGFTIHHATGWYLNFGVLGLLAGAILIGWFWACLHNLLLRATNREPLFWRVFGTFAFWAFTANMPTIIRTGIEGYKGFLFHALVAPTIVLMICSRVAVLSSGQKARFYKRYSPTEVRSLRTKVVRRDAVTF